MAGISGATLDRLHEVLARIDAGRDLREVLQAITDGVVELSGFTIAAISVPRGPYQLEVVAVSGTHPGLEGLLGQQFSLDMIETRWSRGRRRGRFVFLAHDDGPQDIVDEPGILVPAFEPLDHPDAWHPLDELTAPLRSPDGELLGSLGVDLPEDGMRPGPEVLDLMAVFAIQAALAISQAHQRERLREELWLRGMVSDLFTSTGEGPLAETVAEALATVTSEMAAADHLLRIFAREQPGDQPDEKARTWGGAAAPNLTATLSAIGPDLAEHAVRTGRAVVLTRADLEQDHPALTPERRRLLLRACEADGVSRLLLAPLPQGRTVLGQLVLLRLDGRHWSQAEQEVVLDVGRALSWAVQRDRFFTEVAEARSVVAAQRRERAAMLGSLASRVRGWMSEVDDHLHSEDLAATHSVRVAMDGFWGLFGRVVKLTDFQAHPDQRAVTTIDLERLVDTIWERLARSPETTARDVRLLPLSVAGAVQVAADREHLEWLLLALCEDLVRDAPDEGVVRLSLTRKGDRVLVSGQSSARADPEPEDGGGEDEPQESWWAVGARSMLVRMDARLVSRPGPMGRQAVTLDLPGADQEP